MKGRYYQIPIYLLSGSLVVLVIMFVVRGISNKNRYPRTDGAPAAGEVTIDTEVIANSTSTELPLPRETATLETTNTIPVPTDTQTATATQASTDVPDEGCNVAAFIADVTVPDGTVYKPGDKFTKTWQLLNDGSCTWNITYKLYHYSGPILGGPESQQMVALPVPPGTTIEISVDLVAPATGGTYKSFWALKDAGGNHFGISSFKNPFYVEIVVLGPTAVVTDTPTP